MQAHKINLEDYTIDVPTRQEDGSEKNVRMPYHVKRSIEAILFNPALKLGGRELLLQNKIFDKIESASGEILLDFADYAKLKHACEVFEGFRKFDVELVNRILEAPVVEVEEKG